MRIPKPAAGIASAVLVLGLGSAALAVTGGNEPTKADISTPRDEAEPEPTTTTTLEELVTTTAPPVVETSPPATSAPATAPPATSPPATSPPAPTTPPTVCYPKPPNPPNPTEYVCGPA